MNFLPKSIVKLTESFLKLPGIGPKTAQRLALYLLHVPQPDLDTFSQNLKELKTKTVLCSVCKNVTEADPCPICTNPSRDLKIICVVSSPSDVIALEKTGKFSGLYHVLHGVLDPLNNIGPDEIYLSDLFKRIRQNISNIKELIIATNPNMEGEATAMYIIQQISKLNPTPDGQNSKPDLKITRLAHGLPVGADIEYADDMTLSRALEGRREY